MPNRLGQRFGRPSVAGRRIRYAGVAASTALIAGGIFVLAGAGGAGADTGPTQGSSYAQLLQVTPHEGSLAVGAVFGEALAGHTDQVARAQSQGLDLGAVGTALSTDNCNQPPQFAKFVPQPLQTETGAQGADKGITQSPSQSDYGATEYVVANNLPYGEADTTYAGPLADPTNAFVVSGMTSKSWSGVVSGVSEAGATSDIGSLNIGDGAVVLSGLHWQVLYPTVGQPSQSFSIGSVKIAGNSIPSADLSAVADAVNQVISNLGLKLVLPVAQQAQGIDFLSPLQLEVVPNTTRDSLIDPIVTALQPYYFQVANGLENGFGSDQSPLNALGQLETGNQAGQQIAAALCQSDTPITVADITIASLDGGGYFNMALGGVNATSSVLPQNTYNLAEFGAGLLSPGSSQFIPGTAGTPGTLGSGAVAPPAPGGPTSSTSTRRSLGLTRGHLNGAAGGSLLAAGLGGLGLMAFLVEGDRRKMRRAQRAITAEE